jgi:hypothetical protein
MAPVNSPEPLMPRMILLKRRERVLTLPRTGVGQTVPERVIVDGRKVAHSHANISGEMLSLL